MPIYEYKCRECGFKFDRLVRSFGTAEIRCPECGGKETEKMLSVFATSGGGTSDEGACPAPGSACGPGGFS